MAMTEKTSKRIRQCARGSFHPGSVMMGMSDSERSYWKSKKWINQPTKGSYYVLTKKGYNDA